MSSRISRTCRPMCRTFEDVQADVQDIDIHVQEEEESGSGAQPPGAGL
jgi:hypothetical protein